MEADLSRCFPRSRTGEILNIICSASGDSFNLRCNTSVGKSQRETDL